MPVRSPKAAPDKIFHDGYGDCIVHAVVDGSVAGATESQASGNVSAEYALDVRIASTTLHLTFSSDSPMLADALDGDPAVVTTWRGVPVGQAKRSVRAADAGCPAFTPTQRVKGGLAERTS